MLKQLPVAFGGSIVENMVALGVDVPDIFLKGLAAAKTAVDEAGDKVLPDESGRRKRKANEKKGPAGVLRRGLVLLLIYHLCVL